MRRGASLRGGLDDPTATARCTRPRPRNFTTERVLTCVHSSAYTRVQSRALPFTMRIAPKRQSPKPANGRTRPFAGFGLCLFGAIRIVKGSARDCTRVYALECTHVKTLSVVKFLGRGRVHRAVAVGSSSPPRSEAPRRMMAALGTLETLFATVSRSVGSVEPG